MESKSKYLDILKRYWGFDGFRGIQEEIITSICEGHDTLGLMPTGGGKSICFQVPALSLDGICIVVTPLIALMKDQVSHLKMKGIKAEAVYSGMFHDDILRVLDNCILGNYKFLYVSPERLTTEIFIAKLKRMKRVSMITVDEAHCVSQWGYDFRPAYLQIANLRHLIPDAPILALTATATPKVVDDIQKQLEFKEKRVFKMSFERKNLVYVVRETENKADEMLHILKSVTEGSAIVYTRSRQLTREIARFLNENDMSADNYHAGLTDAEKDLRQINWTRGRTRVMVATNAFGMGIDKPDVRLVIHYNMPDSAEAYFQEAGRAGRDGNRAYAILLYNPNDKVTLHRRIAETYPSPDYISKTYENICYFFQVGEGESEGRTYDFSIDKFCATFKQFPVQTESALRLLTSAGYIRYEEEQNFKSRLRFILRKEELYRINEGGEEMETLIKAILRTYSGVFADFVYIEEIMLSHITGIGADRIYDMLKTLNANRVIDFIPHKNTPTITFTLPRIATEQIGLPPSVYKDRKEEYEARIKVMTEYASSTAKCRSRMLLNYFGEKSDTECGQCDVCLRRKKNGITPSGIEQAREAIRNYLSDGEFHPISGLAEINENRELLHEAIRTMTGEEEVELKNSKIRLKK